MAKIHRRPPNNAFISWSGKRSNHVAIAFRDWLPKVIPDIKPWLSVREISKGSRGAVEIWQALERSNIGIICLTRENVREPWILFESGALSKVFSDRTTLVCTYLLGGLEHEELKGPLEAFQYTKPEKEDTRKMLQDIHRAIAGKAGLNEQQLNEVFDALWPELENQIRTMPAAEKADEVVEEKQDEVIPDQLPILLPENSSAESIARWRPWGQTIWVKRKDIDELEYVDGQTYEVTPKPGVLIIYRGPNVLAEFNDVEDWGFWGDNNGAEVKAKYKVDPKLG